MIVRDNGAQVFTGVKISTLRPNPGSSRLSEPQPIWSFFATDLGEDSNGVYFETWAFVVTQKDRNTLITNFYRVANNTDLSLNRRDSSFPPRGLADSSGFRVELNRGNGWGLQSRNGAWLVAKP
jgi:hypothetical protein